MYSPVKIIYACTCQVLQCILIVFINCVYIYIYVDDSNSCLKRSCVQSFHDHLNLINPCIQFTIELPTTVGDNDVISFLDTEVVVRPCGNVVVAVHRKATHTDKYLSFDSHNPKQHKATVVKTLFDQADKIPNTIQGKIAEKQNV